MHPSRGHMKTGTGEPSGARKASRACKTCWMYTATRLSGNGPNLLCLITELHDGAGGPGGRLQLQRAGKARCTGGLRHGRHGAAGRIRRRRSEGGAGRPAFRYFSRYPRPRSSACEVAKHWPTSTSFAASSTKPPKTWDAGSAGDAQLLNSMARRQGGRLCILHCRCPTTHLSAPFSMNSRMMYRCVLVLKEPIYLQAAAGRGSGTTKQGGGRGTCRLGAGCTPGAWRVATLAGTAWQRLHAHALAGRGPRSRALAQSAAA